ncbi:MAG: hypothetical protein LUH19_05040 [Lachnospiraceae bacterium]|nr:hypothetical protein [Lachnospiraceae bacterium]
MTDSSVDVSFLCDLNYYICLASGAVLDSGDSGDGSPHISLSIDSNLTSGDDSSVGTDSFSISDGDIFLTGSKGSDLSQAICQFANTCLGWMYAGTSQEKLESGGILTLPVNTTDTSDAWMEEREAIITLWNTNYSRGIYYNNSTSLKTDIMSFSDEQLYDYVRMLKYCGFTGIQLTDMCSAWACAGSYEFVHERLRILADAAHSLDMNVTLWVWGAEFNGYGWTDDSVTYEILEGTTFVYENPDAVACFDKYYSIYAQLADCADRVIMHFYDPGNLSYTQDVAYFAKMFYDKVSAINPDLNFGVSCYVDVFGKRYLVQTLGTDITLYEQGHHDNESDYVDFREYIAESGVSLGTWAWNTCEMEIDQMASLYFTPHIIQSTYQTALKYDDIAKPEYWSEMDSNHVVNVFSLYCAGQLLIDPYRDVDELIHEIALAAVGEEYADAFSQVLYLIEDARSGESWDTYFWSSDHYILKSEDYDAEDILARSEAAIATLNEIIEMNLEANTLPLPISLTDLLTLMVPYIRQIQEFAQFRIEYGELESMQADGAPAEDIQEKINSISTPISEYNTVIGSWGQIEARAQREMLSEFCSLYGYVTPTDPVYEMDRKYRIYSQFVTFQKGMDEPYKQYSWYFKWIFGYSESDLKRLIEEMEAEGILTRDPLTGEFYLTDWEHYIYAFN